MIHMAVSVFAAAALLSAVGLSDGGAGGRGTRTKTEPTVYQFKVRDIDGEEVSLAKYRGQVCLIVNVASH